MPKIEFFEPTKIPTVTHNSLEPRRSKNGHLSIGKSAALKNAEEVWEAHLARYTPDFPLVGPLSLKLTLCFDPMERSDRLGQPKTTKPDIDNLMKVLGDVMERLHWFSVGDEQICKECLIKGWARPEGIYVLLETIE